MAQRTIGIDISEDLISGVVVSGKGRDVRVVDCATVAFVEQSEVAGKLLLLLEQLDWQGGRCISGVSLSLFSLRNLSLPFTSEKKIGQILPFELEEHLLMPVSEQIFGAVTTSQGEDGSRVFVAAIEKRILQEHLQALKSSGLDPEKICMSGYALADYICATGHEGTDFLLLYGDISSMTLVVCHQKKIVFMRRLPYSEKVFTDTVFSFNGREIKVSDQGAADSAVHDLCTLIQRSIECFAMQADMDVKPAHIILGGPMQLARGFQDQLKRELGLPCKACNLGQAGAAVIGKNIAEQWVPALYDRALALALQGEGKKPAFDFRKDEFALPARLLGSRKQAVSLALAAGLILAACLGYLFFDYKSLQNRHGQLVLQMKQVFKASFPDAARIVDPLAQMRSKLQEVQAPTVSMPLYTQEQRVLAILADISSRVPPSLSMHVTRMVIDEDSIKIKGTTDAFNNVNTIKKLLSKSQRYVEVAIVSATKSKEKNGVRFEIRLQLEENS